MEFQPFESEYSEGLGTHKKHRVSRTISRFLYPRISPPAATIPLGRRLLPSSSNLPGSRNGAGRSVFYARDGLPPARLLPYLVLLRMGFALPAHVAVAAVRSYRTISPLPPFPRAVYFLWHFPWNPL